MFVGREAELAHLAAVVAGVARGGVSAAVVVGEPGVGKSRLLEEAMRAAPTDRTFRVRGYEAEQPVPLAAAAMFLRELEEATGASLLPDTTDATMLEPVRIFESTHRALRECPAVTVFMDDVQWTDELSRALVHYVLVGANAERRPFALVAATRPDATAASYTDSVTRALPNGSVTVLQLGPLTRDEGVELAIALDAELDEARATELWRRSGGVPYWIETLARGRDDADMERDVTTRLHRLDADAIAALAVLVVASRPLTPEAMAEIQGWPHARTEEAIGGLVSVGVASRGPTLVQPTHDLLREEALRRLPDELRRDVHRRLAVFLEGSDDVQSLREAVEHRVQGQLPIADLLERLVTHPQRRLLGREGLRSAYETAGRVDEGRPLPVEAGFAALAAELGEHGLAEALWTAVAETADDRGQAARAALDASRAAYFRDRASAAWRLLERARALCDDDVLAIELDAHEGGIRRWLDHDVEGGELLTRRALKSADELVQGVGGLQGLDRSGLEAVHEALSAGVDAALVADDPGRGLGLAFELVEVAHRLSEEKRLVGLVKRAQMLVHSGRTLEGTEDDRVAWAAARERVLPSIEIEAGFTYATSLVRVGRLEEAEQIGNETAELAARSAELGRMSSTPWRIQRTPLFIQLLRGDWLEAVAELRGAAEAEDDPHRRLHVELMIGSWLARVDPGHSSREVAARFTSARADADAAGCRRCRGDVDVRAAEALARVGLVEESRWAMHEWDRAHPRPGTVSRFWRSRAEAMLAAGDGDRDRAERLLGAQLGSASELGYELESVWIELDLASVLAEDDRARSIQVLRSAANRAERLGAHTQKALALQRLRTLGVRAWRRAEVGDVLTEREREVAELVLRGASNPEIAQALFLSRKTVERHVSNILRKVGARNRAELAARLVDRAGEVEGAPR